MISNSTSPNPEYQRAGEALQKWFEDTHLNHVLMDLCYVFSPFVYLLLSLWLVAWSTLPRCWVLSLAQKSIIMFNWTQIEFKCFLNISDSLLACQLCMLSCPLGFLLKQISNKNFALTRTGSKGNIFNASLSVLEGLGQVHWICWFLFKKTFICAFSRGISLFWQNVPQHQKYWEPLVWMVWFYMVYISISTVHQPLYLFCWSVWFLFWQVGHTDTGQLEWLYVCLWHWSLHTTTLKHSSLHSSWSKITEHALHQNTRIHKTTAPTDIWHTLTSHSAFECSTRLYYLACGKELRAER